MKLYSVFAHTPYKKKHDDIPLYVTLDLTFSIKYVSLTFS